MQTLSIREMRSQLGKLDALIREQHELIITRHNKPVARVLPIKHHKPRPDHAALRNSLPQQNVSSEVLQRNDREERE